MSLKVGFAYHNMSPPLSQIAQTLSPCSSSSDSASSVSSMISSSTINADFDVVLASASCDWSTCDYVITEDDKPLHTATREENESLLHCQKNSTSWDPCPGN